MDIYDILNNKLDQVNIMWKALVAIAYTPGITIEEAQRIANETMDKLSKNEAKEMEEAA